MMARAATNPRFRAPTPKVARRTAVKARTSAMITLKQIVVTAPPARRETLHPLADQALLNRCRGWRCGTIDTPTASAKHTLRALARRWFALSVEIVDHDRHLGRLTTQTLPWCTTRDLGQ